MIHQFIFAYPRPGMTEAEFHRYWLEVHAVEYASKIPQIRRYLIDTRIAMPDDRSDPLWSGVAEIWLENEAEQLASLQSDEFLQGARLDEPKWAAFWRTVALDTTAHVLLPQSGPSRSSEMVKLLILSKRRAGLPLDCFRAYYLGTHAQKVMDLPGLCAYAQGHVRDGFYQVGEALLDCVEQLWFPSIEAAINAQASDEYRSLLEDYEHIAEPQYIHTLLVREHWIIGPEPRTAQLEPAQGSVLESI
jgi:uncharacterized protein (TIGR02118 family)